MKKYIIRIERIVREGNYYEVEADSELNAKYEAIQKAEPKPGMEWSITDVFECKGKEK